jgi:hypothetical protein
MGIDLMKSLWRVALWSGILALCPALLAQKPSDPWPPITQQQLEVKDAPGYPGAIAIQLYFNYFKDDNDKLISVHRRLKVLREPGKKYADVEIPVEPGESLKTLQARTVHPDGSIVDFSDKPFEKILIKKRGLGKYVAQTFTLPSVTVGSIVEYRYVITLPLHVVQSISTWPMQSELFTIKEVLRFRPYQGLVEVPTEHGRSHAKSQVSYTYLNQVKAAIPEKKGDTMELELENVPPFETEPYMPPVGDYEPAILFYYGGRETASPEQYWERWGKILGQSTEAFIGDYPAVRQKALELAGNETDLEKKLRKLYAAAQEIRNVSYERERSAQEFKAEGIKENKTVADVLAHGYGTSSDIDRLFVAMARAAGFDAHELRVSNRLERSFNKLVLSLAQVDDEAAEVTLNSKALVLDPATRFCPFGMLRWKEAGVQALKLSSSGSEFITTPVSEKSAVRRTVKSELLADGTLRGELIVESDGPEALEHRLDILHSDENGRKQMLEAETQSRLPAGAIVRLVETRGWDSSVGPITSRFSLEIPGFASLTGKRLIGPSLLLSPLQKDMFSSNLRRYPISLMYPIDEADEVQIKLPEGYSLEVLPYRRKTGLPYAGYETASSVADSTLTTRRKLHLDGVLFPPDQFSELKEFFSVALAGDAGQFIFQHGTGSAAGSGK